MKVFVANNGIICITIFGGWRLEIRDTQQLPDPSPAVVDTLLDGQRGPVLKEMRHTRRFQAWRQMSIG